MQYNRTATSHAGFHCFESDGERFGSFEVLELTPEDSFIGADLDAPGAPGWYWQACFPGCLPDGDPSGPFETSEAAYQDAQDFA